MSDFHTTATPEVTNATTTAHPPMRENQMEAEVEPDAIAGQRVMRSVGGGSPETPPEQFAGALAGMEGRSQAGMLRQLQRSYGNSYVGVVIQRKADGNGTCADCEKKEKAIQRKADGDVSAVPDGFEATMQRSGAGHPLDEGTRSFMESRFGQNFGDVQIHTDSAAAEASQQIQAQAFTTGRDIYFGRGRYQPQATEGKKLLAHELTHVVQQAGEIQTKLIVGQSGNAYEREADNIAEKLIADTSTVQPGNNINVSQASANVVQRDDTPNNPPSSPPTPDPEAEKKALEERHQKAFDAVQARVGQAAAKVYFSYPKLKNPDETEELFIEEIVKRPPGEKKLLGFETQGAAVVYASLIGAGQGSVVLSQDNLFFAAKLKAGTKRLNARNESLPSFDWKDAVIPGRYPSKIFTFLRSQGDVYRVENYTGVVSVISKEGLAFQLNLTEPPSSSSAQYLNKEQLPSPADAASMREIASIPEIQKQITTTPEQQETFIRQYFHARGLEVLSSNEKETERLTEIFMPTVPGSETKAPRGLSAEAQKMIVADRKQLEVYSKLLEEEVQVEALLSFLEICEERGEFPPFYPVYVKPQKAQVDTMSKVIRARQIDIQQRKIGILGASPLIGQLIGMPDPKSRFKKAERIPGYIVEKIEIPQIRGTSYSSVNESLLAKPTTPENEETIRAEFLKKLDAVRKAIRDTRSEMLGDSDFLLGMEGLRLLVTQDLSRITGENAGLNAKLEKLLQMHKVEEKRWENAELAIQIGLLFIPGAGPFLSAMAGFVMSAEHLSTNLRRWTASQSSVNPATALVDQQIAETQLTQNTIDLTINAVFLATEAINALKTLDKAAGGEKLESAFQQIEKKEAEKISMIGPTASGADRLEVSAIGIKRCSPYCPLLREEFSVELAQDTKAGGTLAKDLEAAESLSKTNPEGAYQAAKKVEKDLMKLRGPTATHVVFDEETIDSLVNMWETEIANHPERTADFRRYIENLKERRNLLSSNRGGGLALSGEQSEKEIQFLTESRHKRLRTPEGVTIPDFSQGTDWVGEVKNWNIMYPTEAEIEATENGLRPRKLQALVDQVEKRRLVYGNRQTVVIDLRGQLSMHGADPAQAAKNRHLIHQFGSVVADATGLPIEQIQIVTW